MRNSIHDPRKRERGISIYRGRREERQNKKKTLGKGALVKFTITVDHPQIPATQIGSVKELDEFLECLRGKLLSLVRPSAKKRTQLQVNGVKLDRSACRVWIADTKRWSWREIKTTAKEFSVLELLMSRPGVVFSRHEILNGVWGSDFQITCRVVDVTVTRLRRKLGAERIRTVHGFGYSFRDGKH